MKKRGMEWLKVAGRVALVYGLFCGAAWLDVERSLSVSHAAVTLLGKG